MLSRITKLIAWDYNSREIKKLMPIVKKINELDSQWNDLSDQQIKDKTQEFKNRLSKGESLDDILPEAFATVKQACRRIYWKEFEVKWQKKVWNMIPYDVQLIWWIILHQWKIAEMKTWEWKTLVASMPLYLNALTWKWVHLVTVNDYLASRDAERLKWLYEWLWLSVWVVTKDTPLHTRKDQYSKDITYVENSELWFDYLRDNLVKSIDERNLLRRPLNFAVIDEVDSILIDEARTPLIISQPNDEPTDKYQYYAKIVKTLVPAKWKKKVSKWFLYDLLHDETEEEKEAQKWDYYIDEKAKTALLSSQWIAKLEKMLWVENLYRDLWYQEIHHIEAALKAQACYIKDKDYIVRDWEVLIVDEHTWRTMPWRRFSEGLHQAIEAKEWLEIKQESKTLATITYQNFFKLYNKLAGMTWTASTEWEEFDSIYNLSVVVVPTNKPVIRVDAKDKVYFNQNAKWKKIVKDLKFYHDIWQPILIWTSSIATSEYVSWLLQQENIVHSVLNAKYHEKEAIIVANAWKYKSVVVATNMAWRWTDIKLEDGLNQKLVNNYVWWLLKQLKNNKSVKFKVFSKVEYDLTIEALKSELWLDENKIAEMTTWVDLDIDWKKVHAKLYFKKQKQNTDPFAEFEFVLSWVKEDVIEKEFHYWLFILWTEKHESRRIDNQLRWRAWRQWDPWYSVFYVALDDTIMRKMWWEKIQAMAKMFLSQKDLEDIELTQKQFSDAIIRAQKQLEAWHFSIRKHLFDYDSVVDKQRHAIYSKRDFLLELTRKETFDSEEELKLKLDEKYNKLVVEFKSLFESVISNFINNTIKSNLWIDAFIEQFEKEFFIKLNKEDLEKNKENLNSWLMSIFENQFEEIITKFDDKQLLINYLVRIYLEAIDQNRVEHIDEMNRLREKVWLMWYAQVDPLVVYKKEAYEKYNYLLNVIKQQTISMLFWTDWDSVLNQWNISLQAEEELLWKDVVDLLKDVAWDINIDELSIDQPKNNVKNYNNWVEVIELSDWDEKSQITNIENVSKKKFRPNDKVTVLYKDWTYNYDVKYKKVKEDIEAWKCKIVW